MMQKSQAWIGKGFDMIIAHHGHTPRAIYAVENGRRGPRTLVADSLGDFVCGFTPEWYHYGMVVKIGLGRDASGKQAAGRLRWEFCETRPVDGVIRTNLRSNFPILSPS